MSQLPTGLILNLLLPVSKVHAGRFHVPESTENRLWSTYMQLLTVSPEDLQDSDNSLKASPVQRLSHRDSEDTR